MNTDKAEILGKPVAASENTTVTSGVREDIPQGGESQAPDTQVQNDGEDDVEVEGGDDSANGDEPGPAEDPFEG